MEMSGRTCSRRHFKSSGKSIKVFSSPYLLVKHLIKFCWLKYYLESMKHNNRVLCISGFYKQRKRGYDMEVNTV